MASLSANSRRNTSPISTMLKDQGHTDELVDEVVAKVDTSASDEPAGVVENIVRGPSEFSNGFQWQHTKTCNERSDSGFSETPFIHALSVDYQTASSRRIEEEPSHMPPVAEELPSELVRTVAIASPEIQSENRVSKMASTNSAKKSQNTPGSVTPTANIATSPPNMSHKQNQSKSPKDKPKYTVNINRTQNLQCRSPAADKGAMRKSDFTNTIQMRKKSLENSVFKERMSVSRAILKPTGKVFTLLQKFAPASAQPRDASKQSSDVVDFRASSDTSDHELELLNDILTANTASIDQSTSGAVEMSYASNDVSSMSNSMKCKHKTETAVSSVFKRLSTNKSNAAGKDPTAAGRPIKSDNITNRTKLIADEGDNRKARANGTASAKSSPSFSRASALRLSARVKEVTERLSAPKSPKSRDAPPVKIATPKSPKISKDRYRQYRNLFSNEKQVK